MTPTNAACRKKNLVRSDSPVERLEPLYASREKFDELAVLKDGPDNARPSWPGDRNEFGPALGRWKEKKRSGCVDERINRTDVMGGPKLTCEALVD